MRPTWHFVTPEDVRWLIELTAPRLRMRLAGRWRQLEIDDRVATRAEATFAAVLEGGRQLTRGELADALVSAGISAEGQRLAHLLMRGELDGLLISGPRRGNQLTYALLEERAPTLPSRDREEALCELARRYFRSHGPAQLQDFVWWSGLTAADARTGIALTGTDLEEQVVNGAHYWLDPDLPSVRDAGAAVHLLPNFDEYTVGYRDRTAAHHPESVFEPAFFPFGSIISNVLTVGGRVRGGWRRTLASGRLRLEVRVLDRLQPAEVEALQAECRRMERFLDRPVELSWV
jgi:hypothetical protein